MWSYRWKINAELQNKSSLERNWKFSWRACVKIESFLSEFSEEIECVLGKERKQSFHSLKLYLAMCFLIYTLWRLTIGNFLWWLKVFPLENKILAATGSKWRNFMFLLWCNEKFAWNRSNDHNSTTRFTGAFLNYLTGRLWRWMKWRKKLSAINWNEKK